MRPPSDVSSTGSHLSSWDFSDKTVEERPNHGQARRPGGWRKMTATKTYTVAANSTSLGRGPEEKNVLSSESEESESAEEETVELVQNEPAVPNKIITETDLNALGAKIMRAELMGNEVYCFPPQFSLCSNNNKNNEDY